MTDDCILDSPRPPRSVLLHSDNILCLEPARGIWAKPADSVCTEYVNLSIYGFVLDITVRLLISVLLYLKGCIHFC